MKQISLVKWLVVLSSILTTGTSTLAQSQPQLFTCPSATSKRTLISQHIASASAIPNLFGAEDSLRMVIKRTLHSATQKLAGDFRVNSPQCPEGCSAAKHHFFELFSRPTSFESAEARGVPCISFLNRTEEQPLYYGPLSFEGLKQFEKWFQSFSQGKNELGEKLYEDCPGACSPQYQAVFLLNPAHVKAHVYVRCGMPRDRSDNQYEVRLYNLRGCDQTR